MDQFLSIIARPEYVVRGFYLGCIAAILAARLSPALRHRFLAYGARASSSQGGRHDQKAGSQSNHVFTLLDQVAGLNVPHQWFTHFYIISVMLAMAWLTIFKSCYDTALEMTCKRQTLLPQTLRPEHVLGVTMMLLQSVRRLYECVSVLKASQSSMWIGHYVFGLSFYITTNFATWVEAYRHSQDSENWLSRHRLWQWPVKVQIGISLFIVGSVIQYRSHAYLASLQKYSLPRGILFERLVAPHYTAECLIYLAISIAAAPSGKILSYNLFCGTLLAAVNLGITAEGTKAWMLNKFRDERSAIVSRYCLIPFIW